MSTLSTFHPVAFRWQRDMSVHKLLAARRQSMKPPAKQSKGPVRARVALLAPRLHAAEEEAPPRTDGMALADVPDAVLHRELRRASSHLLEDAAPHGARGKLDSTQLNFLRLDPCATYRALCAATAQAGGARARWSDVFQRLANHTHERGGKPTSSGAALHAYCERYLLPYLAAHPEDASPQEQQGAQEQEEQQRAATPLREGTFAAPGCFDAHSAAPEEALGGALQQRMHEWQQRAQDAVAAALDDSDDPMA
jgi:hypothetical protein